VLALSQVAFCVGAAAGPAAMALLLPRGVSWRVFFLAEAILALALFVLYSATVVPRPQRPPPAPRDGRPPVWVRASFLFPAAVMFLYVLSETGVIVYVNPYLQQQRMAPEAWGIYGISLIWLAMIAGRLLCAGLPERMPSEGLIAGLCVAGAASLGAQYLVHDWRASFALFGVTGFLFAGVWPLIVAVTAGRHPHLTGSAVGVTIAAGAVGAAVGPLVVSALLRASMAELVLPLLAVPLLIGAAALPLAGGAQAPLKE
jgi:FHS family glucose/mannose:H+ symporter-like MFS transporter